MKKLLKKILAMFICGSFLMSNVLPIRANGEEECPECQIGIQEDYVKPGYKITSNESISVRATFRHLDIDERYQTTSENKKINLLNCNSNYTIYSHGCALTSFTMVVNYLKGTSLYPKNVNSVLKTAFSNQGISGCDMYWSQAADAYDLDYLFSVTNNSGYAQSYYNNAIKTQIDNRVPVIVGLQYASGSRHYVLVKGYEINGSTYTFYINDPNSGNNYSTLNQFVANGSIVRQLVAFDY